MTELANKTCLSCRDNTQRLDRKAAHSLHQTLIGDWRVSDDDKCLVQRFVFKGFAKATYLTNLCVWLADQQGHHPDIAFGWGYCQVTLTTHDLDGLSENDFIWAAKFDNLLSVSK